MKDDYAEEDDFKQIGRLPAHLIAELLNQPGTKAFGVTADERLLAEQRDVALAFHHMQGHGVGGRDHDDAGQQAFNFEDDVDERGRQAGQRAGDEAHHNGELGAVPVHDEDGAGGAADGKSAVHRQVDKAKHAEGHEYGDARQRVTQPLADCADVDVAERHEKTHDDRQQDAAQNETLIGAQGGGLRLTVG